MRVSLDFTLEFGAVIPSRLTRCIGPSVEKERKRAEKTKKFAKKQAKTVNGSATPTLSKTKEKKAKAASAKEEPLPDYVEETPPGEKKSESAVDSM